MANRDSHEDSSVREDEQSLESEDALVPPTDLAENIERPFDPLQIKISRRIVPVDLVVKRIRFGEVELAPDFQRRARIWDIVRKSKLIESILLRIPLPVFYVAADQNENWRVVDGLQRLTTILDFVSPDSEHTFALRGLEYLQAFEGATFDNLPRSIKRRIDETELNINVIESGTPGEVMFNVFKRINTGGITLNGQEIRHALNPGPARGFLNSLAESHEFKIATSESVSDQRMGARELALRFVAFTLRPYSLYPGGDLDGFLNEAMKQLNQLSEGERERLSVKFKKAMIRSHSIFGQSAFRKRVPQHGSKTPINRALFEAWSVALGQLDESEVERLQARATILQREFQWRLDCDAQFFAAISVATGTRSRVVRRFSVVEEIIRETLIA